jgi:diguanylate cyclase (GGDEF)-like protein
LLVDDDPTSIATLRHTLAAQGQLRFATSGADALRLARHRVPDLVLLDVEMPGMTGFEVCAAMKADPVLCDVPIIFITSHDDLEQEVTGLTLGAADFIGKPLRPALVIARVRTQLAMKAMSDALRRAATTDALTGLANRRLLDERLDQEWSRCRRSALPISVLLIDVDCFKAYNDRYGHQAGDACLAAVATVIGEAGRRPADLCARYGGEEFCLLMPETPRDGAWHVAQGVLAGIAARRIAHAASSVAAHVTVSIGVATCAQISQLPQGLTVDGPGRPCTVRDLVAASDRALYAAKHAGRDRATALEIGPGPEPDLERDLADEPAAPRIEASRA